MGSPASHHDRMPPAAAGHDVSLVELSRAVLGQAGFDVHTRLLRAPAGQETAPQASLMARRA